MFSGGRSVLLKRGAVQQDERLCRRAVDVFQGFKELRVAYFLLFKPYAVAETVVAKIVVEGVFTIAKPWMGGCFGAGFAFPVPAVGEEGFPLHEE